MFESLENRKIKPFVRFLVEDFRRFLQTLRNVNLSQNGIMINLLYNLIHK